VQVATRRRATQRERTGIWAGYVRVSTARQDLSPEVQRARIAAKGVLLDAEVDVFEERESGKTINGRPIFASLLERLDRGEFDGLIVAKLDRLSRNTRDFLELVERAQRNGWALVILDLDLDTSTAAGRLVATMFAAVAEWERGVISERTSAALQVKKDQGVKLGTPVATDPATVGLIVALAGEGLSSRAIAARLRDEGVRTATGKRGWSSSTVAGIIRAAREAGSAPTAVLSLAYTVGCSVAPVCVLGS
jgi:DNA invertase Pin-like site-specific DNA recombinase